MSLLPISRPAFSGASMIIRCCAIALLALCTTASFAENPSSVDRAVEAAKLDDGPYLRFQPSGLVAEWVCDGKVVRRVLPTNRWPVTVPVVCGYPHALMLPSPELPPPAIPMQPSRLVALSDIHGQFDLMVRLLRANGVIDRKLRWRYGDGVLVVGGDVFDRGPQVTEAFWLLHQLQQQAKRAGGGVRFVLGNHETMVLYDDLRYVNPKYLRISELLGRSYPTLFSNDSILGQWLRQQPAMARIGDTLFVHGGIEPNHFDLRLDESGINAAYANSLGVSRAQLKQDPLWSRLYDGKTSLIWYRGYFDGRLSTPEVASIVERLDVTRIVVGHTSMDEVGSYHGGRIIAIDSSIKGGTSGEMLFIENGQLSRGTLDGRRLPLQGHPVAHPQKTD